MKAHWVNPFLGSVIDLWKQEFDQSIRKVGLNAGSNGVLRGEVSIVFNIIGSINGIVLYEMDASTAMQIASAKSGGTVEELDESSLNPVRHVIRAVVRQAVDQLSYAGYKCRPTLPKVYQAPGHRFAIEEVPPQVGVVFVTDFGEIRVRVGLTEIKRDSSNVEWLLSQSGLARQ